jgi:hypothetical protein
VHRVRSFSKVAMQVDFTSRSTCFCLASLV